MPYHERQARERAAREYAMAFDRVQVFDDLFPEARSSDRVIQLPRGKSAAV